MINQFESCKFYSENISFHETEISNLIIIEPHMFYDNRGLYEKHYEKNIFSEHGITCEFTESSDLYSKKGALRGLHYQTVDSQAKLIHVICGTVFDVAVDLRRESPTFGRYWAGILNDENKKVVLFPKALRMGLLRCLIIRFSLISVLDYMCRKPAEEFDGMIQRSIFRGR